MSAMDNDQKRLLAIVETWLLNPVPEFRGFRCANCQQYFTGQAWHYLLHEGGYVTSVHFCERCKANFENGTPFAKARIPVDRDSFMPAFAPDAATALDGISDAWDIAAGPVLKDFTCDACGNALPGVKAWHVWRNKKKTLIEYHFDKACGIYFL